MTVRTTNKKKQKRLQLSFAGVCVPKLFKMKVYENHIESALVFVLTQTSPPPPLLPQRLRFGPSSGPRPVTPPAKLLYTR